MSFWSKTCNNDSVNRPESFGRQAYTVCNAEHVPFANDTTFDPHFDPNFDPQLQMPIENGSKQHHNGYKRPEVVPIHAVDSSKATEEVRDGVRTSPAKHFNTGTESKNDKEKKRKISETEWNPKNEKLQYKRSKNNIIPMLHSFVGKQHSFSEDEEDTITRRINRFIIFINKDIIKVKFMNKLVQLDEKGNPLEQSQFTIVSANGIGHVIESLINSKVRNKKAGKNIEVNESSEEWPDYFIRVKNKRIPVELKVFKGNSFANDLGNLRVVLKKMAKFDTAHNDGLNVFLNHAWYVIIQYDLDSDGIIEPKKVFLKRMWQIAGRGTATGHISNGGSGCNLRTNTPGIKKLLVTPVTNTKESFVEAVLDALYSDDPKCVLIRKKASISTEDGITMYNSILKQSKELNLNVNVTYTKINILKL